jgi:hypothetical protein
MTVEAVSEVARSEHAVFDGPDLRRLLWEAHRAQISLAAHQLVRDEPELDRKLKRYALCRRAPRDEFVSIERREGRASATGLQTCGRPWCVLCGVKIAVERAADIALALTEWHARGGTVAFKTSTLPHTSAQSLPELLSGLSIAAKAVREDKTVKRLRKAYRAGGILRLDVTIGPNGWHPHNHEFVFLHPGVTAEQAAELAEAEFDAWAGSLQRQGLGTASRKGYDFRVLDLEGAHEQVARYVAGKAAIELASTSTKWGRGENRSMVQVLRDFRQNGEVVDARIWTEFAAAMYGKRSLRWSPGLRNELLGDLPELTDEEAADATDGAGRLLGVLTGETWRRVLRWGPGPAALLSWAEYGDHDDGQALLAHQLEHHGLGELLQLDEGMSNPPAPPGECTPGASITAAGLPDL